MRSLKNDLFQTRLNQIGSQTRREDKFCVHKCVCMGVCVHISLYVCGVLMSRKVPMCEPAGVSCRNTCGPAEGNWF